MSKLVLKNVAKRYGAFEAVANFSLELAKGEFVSLLGPSGCGKTTTLRMIAGFMPPTDGSIEMDGKQISSASGVVPPEHRRMSMIFQSYAIWPNITVGENVGFGLQVRKLPRAEIDRRVDKILDVVQMRNLKGRYPAELSGGQQQRVALARAIVVEPEVLLLDEPLSNLDVQLREELRAEIATLRARLGTTMVYVTHDQAEALALADRVAVMNQGVLEQVATPQTLYREPATPFVARFVGGANVLDAVSEGSAVRVGATLLPCEPGLQLPLGPGQLVVRPEDLALAPGAGPTLTARLFLGGATEYHFELSPGSLRAAAPALDGLRLGQPARVTLRQARWFPA